MTTHTIRSIITQSLLYVAVAFCLAGCKGNGDTARQDTPTAAVAAFNKAILAKDYKQALTVTDTRQEDYPLFEAWLKMMFDEMGGSTLEVLSAEISDEGNSVAVKVKLTNGNDIDTLYTHTVKTDGVWKVRLVSDF